MNALAQAFAAMAPQEPGVGAAVSVWQGGRQVFHLAVGEAMPGAPWEEDTLAPIFSATKPLAAACLLLALHEGGLTPEVEMGELWPAFPAPRCTVAHVLSHQAGLAALAHSASMHDLEGCRAAIEGTTPAWAPPQHGYHPHTFGPLADILMLRLAGQRIGEFWESRVRRPLGIDAYIGLPESEVERVAHLRLPRVQGPLPSTEFYRHFFDPASPVHRAFHCLAGAPPIREMHTAQALQCASPARGGVASAAGLAMAYQALMGQLPGSPFPPEVQEWLSTPRCAGWDLTLRCHTSFTCGAMCAPTELYPRGGFGHSGFGGSHALCVPSAGLSFAYIPGKLMPGPLPHSRMADLVAALAERADKVRKNCG